MRNNILTLLSILFVSIAIGQTTTNSPYSSYGLGERSNGDNGTYTGIGNSTITYFDSTTLNFYNPSTYNTLAQGQPVFSLGLTSRISFNDQAGASTFNKTAYLEHFSMAFTIKKHFGLAFGLKPFARRGYEITERIAVGTDSLVRSYLGNGGVNQVFIGLSSNLLKLKNTTLSVGGNLGYLFGASTNERRSYLVNGTQQVGGVDWKSTRLNSLYYEFGTYFKQTIKQRHHITLAAVLEPSQKLRATEDNYLFYGKIGAVLGDGSSSPYDTLSASVGQKGTINLAPTMTLGLNYNFWFNDAKKNNSTRSSEIGIHFNYSSTDWSRFSTSFSGTENLLATNKLTVGIQYIPERLFLDNITSITAFEKIRYRAGYYQYSLPYAFNGEQYTDKGITLGLGIPILINKSLSSVNFGFSTGKRQTLQTGSYNEKYIGINFGITLVPGSFERWFVKRKLD